jgi:two-component system response regulator NreC
VSTGGDPADELGGPITIVLAEDHRVVRAGLRLLLDGHPDLVVLAESGNIAVTERRVAAHHPRVLVLDVDMPDGSSIPAIPRILAASPDTRIVILTMHTDPAMAQEAIRAGVKAFVLKEAAEAELVTAIRAAANGRTYLAPELGARLAAAGPEGAIAPTPDGLSARELEVLELIALGHTNAEIATRLYLSVRTVESHRAHIQQKTGCSSRAELVAHARAHHIV